MSEIVSCWWCGMPKVRVEGTDWLWCRHCDEAHIPQGCITCTNIRRDPRDSFR